MRRVFFAVTGDSGATAGRQRQSGRTGTAAAAAAEGSTSGAQRRSAWPHPAISASLCMPCAEAHASHTSRTARGSRRAEKSFAPAGSGGVPTLWHQLLSAHDLKILHAIHASACMCSSVCSEASSAKLPSAAIVDCVAQHRRRQTCRRKRICGRLEQTYAACPQSVSFIETRSLQRPFEGTSPSKGRFSTPAVQPSTPSSRRRGYVAILSQTFAERTTPKPHHQLPHFFAGVHSGALPGLMHLARTVFL